MNKHIILLFFFIISYQAKGQCLVTSLIINTGYDPVSGLAISGGANGSPAVTDPHWKLTAVSPGVAAAIPATPITGLIEVMPGNSADVIAPFFWWVNNPLGNPGGWISCLNSNTYHTDGTGPAGTAYNMTLDRPFRMCSADSIKLSFYIADDNYISNTNIDGAALSFSQPADTPVSNYEMYTYYTQTVFLATGTHTVNIEVNNYNPLYPTGNPTGLDIYGTVSSATGTNSLVSESDPACSSYVCSSESSMACDSIFLPDTLHTCSEMPVLLPALLYGTDSIISIEWTPTTGLSDPAILNPTLSTATPGWYYLTVHSIIPGNLVVNGDFSAGNTGFTNSYIFETAPVISSPNHYGVTTNPAPYSPSFPAFGDHTTGTGNMLLVDGSETIGTNFWCENITVTPIGNYVLSIWSALIYLPQPEIQLTINGTSIGTFTTTAIQGQWVQYQTTWNSGTSTVADICFLDLDTAADGNDFAIDDISFQQLCVAKDSTYISITNAGTTTSRRDTAFCSNAGPIVLNAPAGYSSYLWNTGATTPSVTAGSGIYWVDASISCASVIDTFHVTSSPSPVVDLGNDTSICEGNAVKLSSIQPDGAQYLWSNGSTNSSITVSTAGTYTLTVTQSGCSSSSSVNISELYKPAAIDLGPDTTLCNGDQLILSVSNSDSLLWSTGNTEQNITLTKQGAYWVTTSNTCGSTSDTINVAFELCDIWFPSAFTPNDDGLNDIIRAVGNLQRYKDFSLSIYNRWGQRVFYTEDIYEGWNGKFDGVNQDLGTYYYMMYYSLESKRHMMKGDLELIR